MRHSWIAMKDLTHVNQQELVPKTLKDMAINIWAQVTCKGLVSSKHNPQNFGEVVNESTLMM